MQGLPSGLVVNSKPYALKAILRIFELTLSPSKKSSCEKSLVKLEYSFNDFSSMSALEFCL